MVAQNLSTGEKTLASLSDYGNQTVYVKKMPTKLSGAHKNRPGAVYSRHAPRREHSSLKKHIVSNNVSPISNKINANPRSVFTNKALTQTTFVSKNQAANPQSKQQYEQRDEEPMIELSAHVIRSGKLTIKGAAATRRAIKTIECQKINRQIRKSKAAVSATSKSHIVASGVGKFSGKIVSMASSSTANELKKSDSIGLQTVGKAYGGVARTAKGAKDTVNSAKTARALAQKVRNSMLKRSMARKAAQATKAAARASATATKALLNPATAKVLLIVGAVALGIIIIVSLLQTIVGSIVGSVQTENADPLLVEYIMQKDEDLKTEINKLAKSFWKKNALSVEIIGMEDIETSIPDMLALLNAKNDFDITFNNEIKKQISLYHSILNKYRVEKKTHNLVSESGYPYTLYSYIIFVDVYTVKQMIPKFKLNEEQKEILLELLSIIEEQENENSGGGDGGDGGIVDGSGQLIFPLDGYSYISSPYGQRTDPITGELGEFHTAIDIPAPEGTPIKAALDGTVIFAGERGSYGNLIIVKHENGMETYYAHCSRLIATYGQPVHTGMTIALVGNTGRTTGPHLHFEVRVNGRHQDPMKFF